MRSRQWILVPGIAAMLTAGPGVPARAAVKPGLEGAQDLFRRNHWAEARAHLRSQWESVPEKDRAAASFLIGRSQVREAEFYRAVHRTGAEVGLAYLGEISSVKANRNVALIPLFTGFQQLEAGKDKEAEATLLAAAGRIGLPPQWKASARLRHAVALHRLGRTPEGAAALKDPGTEARFWRLVLTGVAEPGAAAPKGGAERLLAAPVLFRAGRAAEADALLAGLDLELPDAEDKSDPQKVLRFHDPLLPAAWERVCWERAVVALKPLATGGTGPERGLAAYYLGLSFFYLGLSDESAKSLKDAVPSLGPELQPSARLLIAASTWKDHAPAAADLAALWGDSQGQPEAVLLWEDLRRGELSKLEPFATKLDARLKDLVPAGGERPSGSLVGRWGLARLRHGEDPSAVVTALSEYRDKSNKNKLEWNDPVLLLGLVAASYGSQEYPQALETLFELSKTLPGLRGLQWNMQGIYAARQKAGGEARISQ